MSDTSLMLLQAAAILLAAVAAQAYAVAHLPQEAVPQVLRPRIEFCTRLRPWLLGLALGLLAVALALAVTAPLLR